MDVKLLLSGLIAVFLDFVEFLIDLIPNAPACGLSGYESSFLVFGNIIAASNVLIPWSDIFMMMRIILLIIVAQVTVQIIRLIRRG